MAAQRICSVMVGSQNHVIFRSVHKYFSVDITSTVSTVSDVFLLLYLSTVYMIFALFDEVVIF